MTRSGALLFFAVNDIEASILRGCMLRNAALFILAFVVATIAPAAIVHAQKCVAQGDGRTWGACNSGGSSYSPPAPVYQAPSPRQPAAQRQRAAAQTANNRGIAARKRGDLATAVQEFEEAARLSPNDGVIQGNYWNARGELAVKEDDQQSAVNYFREALGYYPNQKDILSRLSYAQKQLLRRKAVKAAAEGDLGSAIQFQNEAIRVTKSNGHLDLEWEEIDLKLLLGRQALARHDWNAAARALQETNQFLRTTNEKLGSEATPMKILKEVDGAANAIRSGDLLTAIRHYDEITALFPKSDWVVGFGAWKGELSRQLAQQKEARSDESAMSATGPVYRDASAPRGYPNLSSYTDAQRSAHGDNEMGNIWAQKGDWLEALFSYQKALKQDPDGPFSLVIKENIDIAGNHLAANRPGNTPPPAGVSSQPALPNQPGPETKEIVASNCTGWMGSGTSFRLCTDDRGQRYCEQADGKGVSRVNCQ